MPNGWPIEIEPPFGFSRSIGHAEPVAAVDHLRREGFVQLPDVDVVDLEPVLLEQLRHREHRTDAHLVGLAAGDRVAAEHEAAARGRAPARASLDITSVADAPSDSCDELPAVTEPCPLVVSNAGGSFASPSSVVSARLHSSRSTVTVFLADRSPVFLSSTARRTVHRRDLAGEEAVLLRRGRCAAG